MAAQVVQKRHVPIDEVRAWRFNRLARAFEQVRRATFDDYINEVRMVEFGVSRAIAPMFSKKRLPALPTSDKAFRDNLFDAPDTADDEDVMPNGRPNFMKQYLTANKLDS